MHTLKFDVFHNLFYKITIASNDMKDVKCAHAATTLLDNKIYSFGKRQNAVFQPFKGNVVFVVLF